MDSKFQSCDPCVSAMGSSSSRMSSADEAVRTCDVTVGFLIFVHVRARFSCRLPDRIALNIVHSIHQMQLQQQQLLQGMASADPPQDGLGGASPPALGGEAPPSGGGEPTTPRVETCVRPCLQCGQMPYFRERMFKSPPRF